VFVSPTLDCPFRKVDSILERIQLKQNSDAILIDFHAEATSEKAALANYLDGRVTALAGTHTHVQTADERLLPKGTAYLTDLGMVGAVDSIIGMKKENVIEKFITGLPQRFQPQASGQMIFNSLLIDIDDDNKVINLERINKNIFLNEE
jgi:calcineurin-like phosphoesterase